MKLLVLGASSQLGRELVSLLDSQQVEYEALATDQVDLLKEMDVARLITRVDPSQVVNVAAYTNLEKAELDPEAARQCDALNTLGVSTLAQACDHLHIPLLHHSSSYVFDGLKSRPYDEDDATNPSCRYGLSKWYGERAIREVLKRHVILRTDWMFSEHRDKFFRLHIAACKKFQGKVEVMDHRFSPTPAEDVARVILAIMRQIDCGAEVWGTYHYCALMPQSQQQFVEFVLKEAAKFDEELAACIDQLSFKVVPVVKPYIKNTVLSTHRIMDTFGIKQRSRAAAVIKVLEKLYGRHQPLPTPQSPEVMTPVRAEAAPSAPGKAGHDKTTVKTRGSRLPARKGARKKSSPPS